MKKTVYFLGAGASAGSDFRLPTMEGFFHKEDLQDKRYAHLKDFIERLYPNTPYSKINMEDVITHLELSLEGFGGNWVPSKFGEMETRRQFFHYISERFTIKPIKPGQKFCEKHKKIFTENFDNRVDTIISLNYDLVVEESYKRAHPYGPLLSNTKQLLINTATMGETWNFFYDYLEMQSFLLKLHGSIDWIYCPNPLCNFHQQFYPMDEGEQGLIKKPCSSCGSTPQIVVIPPTMKKSYEKFPKLGLIWRLAFEELKRADHLIMIGMSLPDSDYYLKWLLKESMIQRKLQGMASPELTIVNSCTSHRGKTKNILGIKDAQCFDRLESYIKRIEEDKPPES